MNIQSEPFGRTGDGEAVDRLTMTNAGGLKAVVISQGATLVEMHTPAQDGRLADLVLGFDDLAGYLSDKNQHFGRTTGRVANRLAGGRFVLDGVEYQLTCNEGANHIHGGPCHGLDKVVWAAEAGETSEGPAVRFTYESPDGQEHYPGNLSVTVIYTLTDTDELRIDYEATTDRATPVNLTNHSYWNLAGGGSVLDHELTINANYFTPFDEVQLPTGEIRQVAGTPLDFRIPRVVGERIAELDDTSSGGYDHNYVLDDPGSSRSPAARVYDPMSGRVMEVFTTEPGVQLYTGNSLKGQVGKGGQIYERRSALCLETQHFPDSVHHPNFPSIILRPGETYVQQTSHRFTTIS